MTTLLLVIGFVGLLLILAAVYDELVERGLRTPTAAMTDLERRLRGRK